MLDKDYRQIPSYLQLGIKVMHHTEFIAEVLPKLALNPSPVTATYHDPCYLARGRGITTAPRETAPGSATSRLLFTAYCLLLFSTHSAFAECKMSGKHRLNS